MVGGEVAGLVGGGDGVGEVLEGLEKSFGAGFADAGGHSAGGGSGVDGLDAVAGAGAA
ncbi:hypothetical protein [Nocardioides sp.]|uniref:hypothetical protein n=1 Tax=Nocardioides sp. TaxID=35761 RepID=UPI003511235B